jgi:hypothetical protein
MYDKENEKRKEWMEKKERYKKGKDGWEGILRAREGPREGVMLLRCM